MRLQPASELDPHIVHYVGHVRDRRTHLRLELATLSVLVVDGVLDRRPYRPGKLNYIPLMIICLAACLVLVRHLLTLIRHG